MLVSLAHSVIYLLLCPLYHLYGFFIKVQQNHAKSHKTSFTKLARHEKSSKPGNHQREERPRN
jgi:hypothetical protein